MKDLQVTDKSDDMIREIGYNRTSLSIWRNMSGTLT